MKKRTAKFIFLIPVLLAGISFTAFAQTKTTILSNGPTANRLNLTLLSEGYRDSEAVQFFEDATNVVKFFLAAEPYREYRNYFNASAIFVASEESGSDHPAYPVSKKTYFNSSYDSEDRFITIPLDKNGKGKADALLNKFAPETDLTILIVNDLVFGGAGGPLLITSRNVSAPEIVVHESGHTLGGLGDEYSDFYPGYPDVEEPNTTRETNRDLIKWKAWITPETPVPTPESADYANTVGIFEGAHYQSSGWYRPKLDCGMRTLGVPFCEICTETLVKAICSRVRLADSFFPTVTKLSVTTTQAMDFHVSRMQPATHDLSLQWFTNDVAISDATNASFQLVTASLAKGTYSVRAEIRDTTPLVRTDPENFLKNSVTWRVTKSFAPPGPFESVKGKFSGLFYETNDVRVASSGLFNLNLTANGAFSGKLTSAGFTSSFKGVFDSENRVNVTIHSKTTTLNIGLEIDLAMKRLRGTISDSNWIADVEANLDTATATSAKFTFLIPGSDETNSPNGDGFASATLRADGSLRLSGKLADGTTFQASGKRAVDGSFPIFSKLYSGRGIFLSWLKFSDDEIEDSDATWIKSFGAKGKLYPAGFTNETVIAGDRYDAPLSKQPALDWTNAIVLLQNGNLETAISASGTLNKNAFQFYGTNKLTLAVTPSSGLLKGKFVAPSGKKSVAVQGVILQKRRIGGGYFLGPTASGKMILSEDVP